MLYLLDLHKPAITSLQEIYDGDDVTLQCVASGTGPIAYLWKQAEAVLFRGQMMVVKNISFVQNTIYSCEASNVAGVRTTDVNLKPKCMNEFTFCFTLCFENSIDRDQSMQRLTNTVADAFFSRVTLTYT